MSRCHEVNEFPGYPFRSEMVASARAQSKGASKHVVAVLTVDGTFVSPECRNRQGEGAEEKCPWCTVSMAHYDHVVWTCSRVFRESGLKNQATRLLLDLVGETLQCLSILLWFENMS